MTNLWRGAAAAAILSGALAGCAADPHYPIREGQTPGPAAFSAPKPQYPIDQQQAAAPKVSAPATADDAGPAPAAQVAPVARVETEALPPPSEAPSATANGAPASASTPADPPPTTDQAPAPAPEAPASNAPLSSEPAMSPGQVIHDQSSPVTTSPAPTTRPTYTYTPTPSRHAAVPTTAARYVTAGQVVDASGDVFENYEVQKGDHIDALARSFGTTRKVILGANHIDAPYLLHPGQILKVPVAKAYVAQSGDTLSGVARRFSVEAGELADLNHISQRASLRAGEEIGLPSSMHDRGAQRVAGESQYAAAEPSYQPHTYQPPAQPAYTPPPRAPITQEAPTAPLTVERGSSYSAPAASAQAQSGLSDAQVAAAAQGRFIWPLHGDILTHFGPQGIGQRNDGIDIKAAPDTVVKAAAGGDVVYAGNQVPGYGNLVLIKHADGWVTAYAHLDRVSVQMKQQVAQGDEVGAVGMTGGVTEPELHFEVRYAPTPADKAKPVDPVLVLPTN